MKATTAEEFDKLFDDGEEDIAQYLDMSTLHKPNKEKQQDELRQLSITLPEWLVATLDREASRIGVSRQAVMKMWLVERADTLKTA